MYLMEDDKCIFTDEITCIEGNCKDCEIFLKYRLKTVQLTEPVQITIEEYLNERKGK